MRLLLNQFQFHVYVNQILFISSQNKSIINTNKRSIGENVDPLSFHQ